MSYLPRQGQLLGKGGSQAGWIPLFVSSLSSDAVPLGAESEKRTQECCNALLPASLVMQSLKKSDVRGGGTHIIKVASCGTGFCVFLQRDRACVRSVRAEAQRGAAVCLPAYARAKPYVDGKHVYVFRQATKNESEGGSSRPPPL